MILSKLMFATVCLLLGAWVFVCVCEEKQWLIVEVFVCKRKIAWIFVENVSGIRLCNGLASSPVNVNMKWIMMIVRQFICHCI